MATVQDVADALIAKKINFGQARDMLQGVVSTTTVQPVTSPDDMFARSEDDPEVPGPNDTMYLQLAVVMGAITNDQMTQLLGVMS